MALYPATRCADDPTWRRPLPSSAVAEDEWDDEGWGERPTPMTAVAIRLEVDAVDAVRALAGPAGLAPAELLRRWVLERLAAERAPAAEEPAPPPSPAEKAPARKAPAKKAAKKAARKAPNKRA